MITASREDLKDLATDILVAVHAQRLNLVHWLEILLFGGGAIGSSCQALRLVSDRLEEILLFAFGSHFDSGIAKLNNEE